MSKALYIMTKKTIAFLNNIDSQFPTQPNQGSMTGVRFTGKITSKMLGTNERNGALLQKS